MLELERWRKVALADGRVMTAEMTGRQRGIQDAFNLMCPISPGGAG
ncbi:hypothetical protein [Methanoculleus receptaculi]|uniref:Uncharacterized protein n=1 Tax=Methanoculleus receptaculi TaxID=394967 RepID=A0AAX4FV43_9EURY|nr:hypothetical protein [Methanoculleus receptaculi]WOX57801.1 hypothetical protein R6Y96_00670 [Methanoculleus receptaculi]